MTRRDDRMRHDIRVIVVSTTSAMARNVGRTPACLILPSHASAEAASPASNARLSLKPMRPPPQCSHPRRHATPSLSPSVAPAWVHCKCEYPLLQNPLLNPAQNERGPRARVQQVLEALLGPRPRGPQAGSHPHRRLLYYTIPYYTILYYRMRCGYGPSPLRSSRCSLRSDLT